MNFWRGIGLPAFWQISSRYFCWKSPRHRSPVSDSSTSIITRIWGSNALGLYAVKEMIYSVFNGVIYGSGTYRSEVDLVFKFYFFHH